MGRFDGLCFGHIGCSVHSGESFDSSAGIDFSAMQRIAMAKSIITAQAKNPFKPQGFGFLMFDRTINHIFNNSLEKPSLYVPYARHLRDSYRQQNQPHNHILSIYLELGILGVLGIGAFMAYLCWLCLSVLEKDKRNFVAYFGIIFVVGLLISSAFHNYWTRSSIVMIFIVYGFVLGSAIRILAAKDRA